MKKPVLFLAAAVALSVTLVALAAGGDASDPLALLSYLNGTFTNTVDAQVDAKLNDSDAALLANTETGHVETTAAATWVETRLKQDDGLLATTGTNVLVLAGKVNVFITTGTVVDVTAGTTVPSGSVLTSNHRYMAAEDTSAVFSVVSKTAVVDYQGPYAFNLSAATDYNAMAAALKTLHLFKGSFTGYGEGYDLEVAPTRLQALIMFIRVLGEEEAALSWSGSIPFTDVAAGTQAAQYVGYAYAMGYTNGFTATTFRPAQGITVNQYMEFMLRALGYSSSANTDLASTLDNAVASGVITPWEQAMLTATSFLRAELVYISYCALDATEASSGLPLSEVLQGKGVFTTGELDIARSLVPGGRM